MQTKAMRPVAAVDKPLFTRALPALPALGRMAPILIAGLFLARAELFGELSPFSLSFFAAVRVIAPGSEWLTALMLMIGVLWRGGPMQVVSFVAMALSYIALEKTIVGNSRSRILRAAMAGIAIMVVRLPLFFWQAPTLFEGVVTLLEVAITMVMTLIFVHAVGIMSSFSLERSWRTEEMLAMSVTGAVFILGLSGIAVNAITLQGVVLKYLVMLAGYVGGASWGAAMGGAAPFVIYLGDPLALAYVGTFSFAGMASGALRDWRKPGVILGFSAAMALTSANFGGRAYLSRMLIESLIAGLGLLLTARQTRSKLYRLLPMAAREEVQLEPTYSSRLQVLAHRRLRDLCAVFVELAETFSEPASQTDSPDHAANKLMERLARDVCEECSKNRSCWGNEFYRTYQSMLDMFALTDAHGTITQDMLPEPLRRRCERSRELVRNLNSLSEMYRQNLYWEQRALDTRQLVAKQLQGVAKIMASLSADLNLEVEYLRDSEQRIQRELAASGIFSPEVEVVKSENGRVEVSITKHACSLGENHCATILGPLVTEVIGRQVTKENRRCASLQGKTKCSVCLSTAHVLATDTGVAQLARSQGVCGDTYRISEMVGGKLALMVSDGMGDGPLANQESRTAINLLEQMMRAGFDKEVTLQTINSVLALRSQGETFATVDMALIDLYSGNTELVKIGASSSYLRRGDRVEVIRAASLPAGILANIEVETRKLALYPGDVLVMLSDGVLDGQQGVADKEEWLSRILRQATVEKAQDLAEYILNRARNNFGGNIPDDMTVVVLKILDKAVSIPLVG